MLVVRGKYAGARLIVYCLLSLGTLLKWYYQPEKYKPNATYSLQHSATARRPGRTGSQNYDTIR